MGFLADIFVWDFETREIVYRLSLHKVSVVSLAFSPDEMYLASLGGQDDNNLIIWDMSSGKAVCRSVAAQEPSTTVVFLNNSNNRLVTGGNTLSVWEYNHSARKLDSFPCNMGKNKRTIKSIVVDQADEFMYCGTASGDLLQVSLQSLNFKTAGPPERLSLGISTCTITTSGDILVGAGDGTIALLRRSTLRIVRQTKVQGNVTSISLNRVDTSVRPPPPSNTRAAGGSQLGGTRGAAAPTASRRSMNAAAMATSSLSAGGNDYMLVGTDLNNIYGVALDDFEADLKASCHYRRVNQVVFPRDYSALFGTCSGPEIRVWNVSTCQELLRIVVPTLECLCMDFMSDGGAIISGWNDGKIRAFRPQTGTLMYTIQNAHKDGVTAIASSYDSKRIISGGKDATVRVWKIGEDSQTMETSMKEHRGPVNSVHIRPNDKECLTSSDDGSCVIWDLTTFKRSSNLFASTHFKIAKYYPDASQMLTTGTDRKITYWDAFDGSNIRELDGSASAECNALDISRDGALFASGGGDRLLKLWHYDDGIITHVGHGHSGGITGVCFSPDMSFIVSVGDEGGVFIWRTPE